MSQKLLITAYSHTSHSPSNFGKKKKFKLFVKRKVLIQTYLFFLMADQSVPIFNWRVVRNLKSMVLLLLGLCLLVKLSPTCMFDLRANIIYKIVAHPKNCETFKSHRYYDLFSEFLFRTALHTNQIKFSDTSTHLWQRPWQSSEIDRSTKAGVCFE